MTAVSPKIGWDHIHLHFKNLRRPFGNRFPLCNRVEAMQVSPEGKPLERGSERDTD